MNFISFLKAHKDTNIFFVTKEIFREKVSSAGIDLEHLNA
jgi:hypothetical protein